MGPFSDFLAIFQYNFGDFWDIHGLRPIILGYFFATIMMEIGGNLKKNVNHFLRDLLKSTRVYWYNRGMCILLCFFLTRTMEMITFHFMTSMIQGGNFSKNCINFYTTYERGVVDITMACDISI